MKIRKKVQCVYINKSDDQRAGSSLTLLIDSIPLCSLLSNSQFVRKQNGLKLK